MTASRYEGMQEALGLLWSVTSFQEEIKEDHGSMFSFFLLGASVLFLCKRFVKTTTPTDAQE